MAVFFDEHYSRQKLGPILFVEDSADDFFLAQRELKRLNIGSPLHCVESIHDMFDYLSKRGPGDGSEGQYPCVIIMDMGLRGEGGLAGVAKLRSNLKYHRIPILAISSIDQLTHLKVAVENGAKGHLLKPFNGDEFIKHAAQLKLPLDFDAV